MASLLKELIPPRDFSVTENVVDSLTPTMIADTYMDSKINSIRIAILRGYNVSDEERGFVDILLEADRADAHALFIEWYAKEGYLTLSNLNARYTFSGKNGLVVGEQRRNLFFYFYPTDGPIPADVVIEDDSELITVGLNPIVPAIEQLIVAKMEKKTNTKFSKRVTSEMALWPIDNAFVPKYKLHKKASGVEHVAQQRGTESLETLSIFNKDEIISKIYGAEKGDIMIATRLVFDISSMTKRSVSVHYVE